MKIPAITGVIRRRVLLNYRACPRSIATLLPRGFRPKTVSGFAIAGICLIRLEKIRPSGFPVCLGIDSENSAHRIAVEWEGPNREKRDGVFVSRRDTDSRINSFAGGRVFPGVHRRSQFKVIDKNAAIEIRVTTRASDPPLVDLHLKETSAFPATSVFRSLAESSAFFEAGCVGYSSRPDSAVLDGLLLRVPQWEASPLEIVRARSSFFDDHTIFPAGSIELDHALLMRDIEHEWHSEPQIRL